MLSWSVNGLLAGRESGMKRLVWALAFFGALFLTQGTSVAKGPNVLLVLADDMTYHDCGAYGSDIVRTPNIDRLAREGMLFQRMFTIRGELNKGG